MYHGWQKGITLYVFLSKRFRKGQLKRKKGAKWLFLPDGYVNPVTVCPVRSKWHYAFKKEVWKWRMKIRVLVLNDKPFRFQRERHFKWTGAKTGRTNPVQMQVWQIRNTGRVIVGHLGEYKLVRADGNVLSVMVHTPCPDIRFFIGRGELIPKKFKCLKLVSRPAARAARCCLKPLYKVPTREELG